MNIDRIPNFARAVEVSKLAQPVDGHKISDVKYRERKLAEVLSPRAVPTERLMAEPAVQVKL